MEQKKRAITQISEDDQSNIEAVPPALISESDVKLKKKKKKIKVASKTLEAVSSANENSEDNAVAEAQESPAEVEKENVENPLSSSDPESVSSIFSGQLFSAMPISDKMKSALDQLGFSRMTEIQAKSIPESLLGHDVVGAAKTGSGKTLAFLIPIIELLTKIEFTRKQGTGAIIISPTRELSLQIYGVLRDLAEACGYTQTHGLVIGGANRGAEVDKLVKGVSILVCTPGRLLDHLMNTKGFATQRLQMLVMDEADRILEQGFEEDLHQIIKLLPKERQTLLFSATQTRSVQDLARLSMRGTPMYVGVHDEATQATVAGLQQGFVLCPPENRFLLLYTFLKKNLNKKIMVFFSSCNSVKFHAELLNYIDVPVLDIHGKQKQQRRTTTFFSFCKQETGILLCTDVAARGLDIPAVDWIVQYDPPDDPKEYIHRVGRTARGTATCGRALLFLLPEEVGFLKYLRKSKVTLQEFEFPVKKIANIGPQMTMLIEKNYYLNKSARDAYRSYLLSYASHAHKDIFNVQEIDLQGIGKAFGFSVPPRVDLNFNTKGDRSTKRDSSGKMTTKMKKAGVTSGQVFSATNPYGKREASDNRQFTR